MPRRPVSRLEGRDFPLMVALSVLFFILVAATVLRERSGDWLAIQRSFAKLLAEHGQVQAAHEFTIGVRQIWIPDLGRVDRCVTCHLGDDTVESLPADLPQPFAPHPDLPFMRAHPFSEFGCTSCHGGQGFATETRAAHGEVVHWDEPLLSRRLAATLGLGSTDLLQTRCNACHRRETTTIGMETLNHGKELYRKKKCVVCHMVEGKGGLAGPELTSIGDKDPELFDFSHVQGPHTELNWHRQHLTSAQTVSPGTTMPDFGLAPEDASALALLLLSWRHQSFPPRYLPGASEAAPGGAENVVREPPPVPSIAGAESGRAAFLSRGCNTCHSVGAGVLLGPDLKAVGSRRDPDWLRRWLADPAAMIRAIPELRDWPSAFGNVVMPNQNLDAKEIDDLVAFLSKL
ncbi:MAG TPA: c-type cytochrome [Candidatus Bathyarchaeia archaeon]|nr:c-type cytochrome [Candidatus Bathyarchaeia archaeon]